MKVGYVRVSTKEQHEDRQLAEIRKYVEDERNIFIDKQSGRTINREGYEAMKHFVRPGDEVFFHELDRLGRNKSQIKKEIEAFGERGVIVRILDVPTTMMDYSGFGDMGKLIMEMVNNLLIEVLATLAESEIQRSKKRQREGIEVAKAKGKHMGRPRKQFTLDERAILERYFMGKIKEREVVAQIQISKPTLYKLKKEWKSID